jgi:hypothetical protein
MKLNPVTLILFIAFIAPLLKGFFCKFSSKGTKKDISNVGYDIAFILALFLGSYLSRKIFVEHDDGVYRNLYNMFPSDLTSYIQGNNLILYIVIMPVLIFLIFKLVSIVFYGICLVTVFPILDGIEKKLKSHSNGFRRTLGVIFQFPRALAYILVISLILNISSMLYKNSQIDNYLQQSKLYNNICKEVVIPLTKSNIAKNLPNIINNSFRIQIKNGKEAKAVVYYNGVTLDEGIKSNANIDNFAKKLADKQWNTSSKAKVLYNWVGKNIDYDSEKANAVLNNNFTEGSGAITAYETRKGICFDYACLYAAMCRANKIKVRLITGYGFNGVSWVGHAWNQVYLPEENRWINVDTTFSKGGNYFDTDRFNTDHKDSEVAGEW